jgi:hypothetical protein
MGVDGLRRSSGEIRVARSRGAAQPFRGEARGGLLWHRAPSQVRLHLYGSAVHTLRKCKSGTARTLRVRKRPHRPIRLRA